MATLSPRQHSVVKDAATRSSLASSSVVESTDTDGYDDIFDRLDTDLPVLMLATTTDNHDAYEDGISTSSNVKVHTPQGKVEKLKISETQTKTQTTQEEEQPQPAVDEQDVIEKCNVKSDIDFYSLVANDSQGVPFDFSTLKGKYVLICNVASMCGFSFQLRFLNDLHEKYKDEVVVLGFPSNNFAQEWFSAEDASICYKRIWNCNFKIMEKIRVNGKKQHQVFRYLKDNKKGFLGTKIVKWNFEKFLVDREGTIIRRYSTFQFPYVIKRDLDSILESDSDQREFKKDSTSETLKKTDTDASTPTNLDPRASMVIA